MLKINSISSLIIGMMICCLLTLSCKKDKDIPDFTVLTVDENEYLSKTVFVSGTTGFSCGGKRAEYGHIYKTIDGGASWKKLGVEEKIYDLFFLDEQRGFAGGDSLYLLKTTDGGNTWQRHWFSNEEIPMHENDRTAIKRIFFLDDETGFFAGGQNYNKGLVYRSSDGGKTWHYQEFAHEIKGLHFSSPQHGFISGYGIMAVTDNGGEHFQRCEIHHDFFVSVQTFDDFAIAAGNNGGIYKSVDKGESWENIKAVNKPLNRRIAFNDMQFADKTKGIAVGNYGLIMRTSDGGDSWEEYKLPGDPHLNSISFYANKAYISSSNGKIYVVD